MRWEQRHTRHGMMCYRDLFNITILQTSAAVGEVCVLLNAVLAFICTVRGDLPLCRAAMIDNLCGVRYDFKRR